MSAAPLFELQSAFKRYLFAGDNEADLARLIRSGQIPPAPARLDVYRNAYYTRLQEALAHDFPVVLAVAGDAAFGRLATEYLRDHPSTHPSLRWLGQYLPGWFRRRGEKPALTDLAALEWAVLQAFDAPNAPVISARDFDAIAPDHWPELRLTLHPALTLLTVHTNVRHIWSAVRRSLAVSSSNDFRAARHLAVGQRSFRRGSKRVVVRPALRLLRGMKLSLGPVRRWSTRRRRRLSRPRPRGACTTRWRAAG